MNVTYTSPFIGYSIAERKEIEELKKIKPYLFKEYQKNKSNKKKQKAIEKWLSDKNKGTLNKYFTHSN